MVLPTSEARRSPRIVYQAAVEVLAQTEDDDAPRTLAAEAVDLGAGGMRLAVGERVPVGAPLTCRINLDGRVTALTGHVVWLRSHTAPRPHGMGVRFDGLAGYEQRLLAHLVERSCAGYRPVQLRFDGLDAPVTARALPHSSGLTLSAALPFLDRGTGVDVQLEPEGAELRGRVDEVRVVEVDARRRLEVEVALQGIDHARMRRPARYATDGGKALLALSEADHTPASPATATRPLRIAFVALRALGMLAAGVLLGLALAPGLPVLKAGLARAPQALRIDARPAPAPVDVPATATATAAAALATTAASEPAWPAPTTGPKTIARAAAVASAGGTAPPADVAAMAEPVLTRPVVAVDGDTTLLRLPFAGSLEGMVARTWADPPVLALDLPNGRVPLADGGHAVHGGGVAGIRLGTRSESTLLRVRLAAPIGRYAVSVHEGLLELRLFASPPQ